MDGRMDGQTAAGDPVVGMNPTGGCPKSPEEAGLGGHWVQDATRGRGSCGSAPQKSDGVLGSERGL